MQNNSKLKQWILFNLKIGVLSFGGSGRILLYQDQIVNKFRWLSDAEVRELATLGQAIPGPNLVNMAHLIGQRVLGFWGSFLGLIALITPGSLMALALYQVLPMNNYWVRVMFQGFTLGSLFVFMLFVHNYYLGVFEKNSKTSKWETLCNVLIMGISCVAILWGMSFLKVLIWGAVAGIVKEFARDFV